MLKKVFIFTCFGFFGLIAGLTLKSISPEFPIISDSKYYLEIGQSLKNNEGFIEISEKKIIAPPIYPIFISFFPLEKDNVVSIIYTAQTVLLGLSAGLIYLISRELLKRKYLAWLASIITFFWPYSLFYTQLISSEILYLFLLFSSIYAIVLLSKTEDKKEQLFYSIICGILIGITTLQRAVTLLLPIAFLIFTIIKNKIDKSGSQIKIKNIIILVIVSYITLVPWEIYVYKKFDKLIPGSSFTTVNEKGNKTFAYLNDNKEEFKKPTWIEAKLKNIYLFWDPGAGGYHVDILKEKYPVDAIIFLYKIVFFFLVAIFLIGIFGYIKVTGLWMVLSVILYTWALHVALFPFPRYTFPIMPLVTILSFSTFESFLIKLQKRVKKPLQQSSIGEK